MKIEKSVSIQLKEEEICKIIAKHLSETTEYKVRPEDVHFRLDNEPSEFGGNPTPYLRYCEVNTKI